MWRYSRFDIAWSCGYGRETAARRVWPCWAGGVVERSRYPSDPTAERWALIKPVITAWKAAHPSVNGHQGHDEMREIINVIFHRSRTGWRWEYLPHDLPPPRAVKYYFYKWRDDGTTEAIQEIPRCQVRERAGRTEDPSPVVPDSRSVHAAVNVPATSTGRDAAKKVPGRKKDIAVDVLGLIIAVVVMTASVHENTIGTALLDKVAARTPAVTKALVDQGFKTAVVTHGAKTGTDVEIVERNPQDKGLIPQPIRRRVGQALGTTMRHRRPVRDYEINPATSETRVYRAITDLMTRRPIGTSTPTRRGT